jgi:hypothetical protein
LYSPFEGVRGTSVGQLLKNRNYTLNAKVLVNAVYGEVKYWNNLVGDVPNQMRLLKKPVRREDLPRLGVGFSGHPLDLFHLPNALQAVLGFRGRRWPRKRTIRFKF